jgi:hypothetical protein
MTPLGVGGGSWDLGTPLGLGSLGGVGGKLGDFIMDDWDPMSSLTPLAGAGAGKESVDPQTVFHPCIAAAAL